MPDKNFKAARVIRQIRRQQLKTLEAIENLRGGSEGEAISASDFEAIRREEEKILKRIEKIRDEQNQLSNSKKPKAIN